MCSVSGAGGARLSVRIDVGNQNLRVDNRLLVVAFQGAELLGVVLEASSVDSGVGVGCVEARRNAPGWALDAVRDSLCLLSSCDSPATPFVYSSPSTMRLPPPGVIAVGRLLRASWLRRELRLRSMYRLDSASPDEIPKAGAKNQIRGFHPAPGDGVEGAGGASGTLLTPFTFPSTTAGGGAWSRGGWGRRRWAGRRGRRRAWCG